MYLNQMKIIVVSARAESHTEMHCIESGKMFEALIAVQAVVQESGSLGQK